MNEHFLRVNGKPSPSEQKRGCVLEGERCSKNASSPGLSLSVNS